jgi:glycosyltransferase involved in cell wall biosynthesis
MSRLTISIAMCSYNGEKYLQEQLDSIAGQSRLPDELVVCDDNSSDQSIVILEGFSTSSPFPVRIVRNDENIGSTKNFEKTITLCNSDIIALSDQDDIWHKDKLKLIEEVFISSKRIGVVFSNGKIVSEDLLSLGYSLWDTFNFKKKDKTRFLNGKTFEIILNHNVITGATMAFHSDLRNKILPISPIWVHDSWIAFLSTLISEIKFIDKELVDYRQHKNQQIGGLEMNIADKIFFSHSVTNYNLQILQYKQIIEHILNHDFESKHKITSIIYDKITHLNNRQNIYLSNGWQKISKALYELTHLRYHKFSNGFISFIKDILTSQ